MRSAPAAHATFPGANGNLVVSADTCEFNPHLRAVSPGGKHLGTLTEPCRYDEGADDYVGAARRPEWAPDGSRVLYSQPDGLFTIAAGEGDRRGLPGTDQRRLRARPTRPRDRNNCVIDARSGQYLRRVVSGAAHEPDWSPDGRRIVYRTSFQQDEIRGGASGGNIWTVRRDGRDRRRLVHRKGMAEAQPVFSPDGRWIAWIGLGFGSGDVAYDVRATIMRMRVKGEKRHVVRRLPSPSVEEGDFHLPEPAWQPLLMRR